MAKLILSTLASFDGYNAEAAGSFDWAAPDEAMHRFVNDLSRSIGQRTFYIGTVDLQCGVRC